MGAPKALLEYRGRTFLDRAVALLAPHCTQVVVVLGHHAAAIRARTSLPPNACFVENPDPDRGMLSSLQAGLRALDPVEAVLFTPVDLPAISPEVVGALVREFEGHLVAIPRHRGRNGHPVLCAAALILEFLDLPETARPSDVIHNHSERTIYIDVDDPGVVADIDRPEDYQRLLA